MVKMNKLFLRPYIYSHTSYSTKLNVILVLLGVQVILLALDFSFASLLLIAVCTLSAVGAALLNERFLTNRPLLINTFSERLNCYKVAVIQGLLVGFFTPESYPLLSAFVVTFFICALYKHLFGSPSRSLINPVAFCVVTMYLCNRFPFGGFFITPQSIRSGFPSVALVNSNAFTLCPFKDAVTNFLNSAIFSKFDTSLPPSLICLLWDTHSPIPAARYNLLNIAAIICLCSNDNGRLLVTAIYLPVYAVLVRFLTPLLFLISGASLTKANFFFGDIFLALNSSGVLFFTAFLLCTSGSLPIKKKLRVIYSLVAAVVTFFVAGVGTSPIGMCTVALIMNFVTMLLRHTQAQHTLLHTQELLEKSKAQ